MSETAQPHQYQHEREHEHEHEHEHEDKNPIQDIDAAQTKSAPPSLFRQTLDLYITAKRDVARQRHPRGAAGTPGFSAG